jgi:hypothetical protein
MADSKAEKTNSMAGPRFGDGHVAAMGRLGFQELRNAINPSRESVAGTELGLFGTQTQGEIADNRKSVDTMDGLRSAAMEKQQDMQKGMDGPERNGPDRGMER